ncbi:hypothetical protein GPUN_2804 [Glaciecola punicea ACAM 611]|uniref:Transposase n=1 Tax=Glaciecola punicea ACAM 611 TaxID=1121923 RepID=H5TEZ1_9ALTE|nr:hypothetical protein GPUN_2804 [Glaciecola punicea ACAM 611]
MTNVSPENKRLNAYRRTRSLKKMLLLLAQAYKKRPHCTLLERIRHINGNLLSENKFTE